MLAISFQGEYIYPGLTKFLGIVPYLLGITVAAGRPGDEHGVSKIKILRIEQQQPPSRPQNIVNILVSRELFE